MKPLEKAPFIPGVGEPGNLIQNGAGEGLDACPCCGAVWKGGQPWSENCITPVELARRLGITVQAVNYRIRGRTIASYLRPSRGNRNAYLVPIFEANRVMALQDVLPDHVEDLGSTK